MVDRSTLRDSKPRKPVRLCVGIAAARSSLSSLRALLSALPADAGLSVIAIIAPEELDKSESDSDRRIAQPKDARQFLSEANLKLTLEFVDQPTKVRPNTIYVVHELLTVSFSGNSLLVTPPPATGLAGPADHFLSSLAEEKHELAVGIVLADSGNDGLLGLKSINDAGGMTIVEKPESSASPMPTLAHTQTSGIDHVLPMADIAIELSRYVVHVHESSQSDREAECTKQIIEAIPAITEAVEKHTSHNFRHYKVTTLARRIKRRMQVLKQSR